MAPRSVVTDRTSTRVPPLNRFRYSPVSLSRPCWPAEPYSATASEMRRRAVCAVACLRARSPSCSSSLCISTRWSSVSGGPDSASRRSSNPRALDSRRSWSSSSRETRAMSASRSAASASGPASCSSSSISRPEGPVRCREPRRISSSSADNRRRSSSRAAISPNSASSWAPTRSSNSWRSRPAPSISRSAAVRLAAQVSLSRRSRPIRSNVRVAFSRSSLNCSNTGPASCAENSGNPAASAISDNPASTSTMTIRMAGTRSFSSRTSARARRSSATRLRASRTAFMPRSDGRPREPRMSSQSSSIAPSWFFASLTASLAPSAFQEALSRTSPDVPTTADASSKARRRSKSLVTRSRSRSSCAMGMSRIRRSSARDERRILSASANWTRLDSISFSSSSAVRFASSWSTEDAAYWAREWRLWTQRIPMDIRTPTMPVAPTTCPVRAAPGSPANIARNHTAIPTTVNPADRPSWMSGIRRPALMAL